MCFVGCWSADFCCTILICSSRKTLASWALFCSCCHRFVTVSAVDLWLVSARAESAHRGDSAAAGGGAHEQCRSAGHEAPPTHGVLAQLHSLPGLHPHDAHRPGLQARWCALFLCPPSVPSQTVEYAQRPRKLLYERSGRGQTLGHMFVLIFAAMYLFQKTLVRTHLPSCETHFACLDANQILAFAPQMVHRALYLSWDMGN